MTSIVFDVEGTLIDCVTLTLKCWHQTLASYGYLISTEELHRYSGMDARLMLTTLLGGDDKRLIRKLLKEQGERYRNNYLEKAHPFPGAHGILSTLSDRKCQIALATTCQPDELRFYLKRLHAAEFVDAVACGADVKQEKPAPDLITLAMQRLPCRDNERIWNVGDTPYDAKAGLAAGTTPIGTLGGGFSRERLQAAGCLAVAKDFHDLSRIILHHTP